MTKFRALALGAALALGGLLATPIAAPRASTAHAEGLCEQLLGNMISSAVFYAEVERQYQNAAANGSPDMDMWFGVWSIALDAYTGDTNRFYGYGCFLI